MRHHSFKVLAIAMSLMVFTNLSAQDCSCVDCPIDIFNLQTHTSTIDVQVAGPNDLGSCGINEVCFTIAHTWVGDLSVSLVSPAGLKYLVMADAENMPPNGCGNSENNLDVCITTGTSNPITNNTEYVCNGSSGFCMEGGFTVPCGGVTDPFDGALQAPNCDLNDFNVPGHPANGQWTLVVNDICNLNIGQLIDWSISFDCGTSSCIGCDADGGDLTFPDFEACVGAPELDLTLSPIYSGSAPDPALFAYTYLVIDGGVISAASANPNLQGLPSGIYSVCGISYEIGELAAVEALVGTDYSSIGSNLGICFDLSQSCLGVEIFDPVPTYTEVINLCFGECYTALDGLDYCSTGNYTINYISDGGCTSSMMLELNIGSELTSSESLYACTGEEVSFNGLSYGQGNYDIVLSAAAGCDSTVVLTVEELNPIAIIQADQSELDCDTQSITLENPSSGFQGMNWYDENWTLISSEDSIIISSAGIYNLEVFASGTSGNCLDTASITINDVGIVPDDPIFNASDTTFCLGAQFLFCVDASANVDNWVWSIPSGASILGPTNGNCIEVIFNQDVDEEICVFGENGCGQGNTACVPVLVASEAQVLDFNESCDLSTETFDLEIVMDGAALFVASTNILSYTFDGTTFLAQGLPGGMNYTVAFESPICGGLEITNVNDCLCGNESPVLVSNSTIKCIGEAITFESNGPVNDAQYASIFVLHTDPVDILGTQLVISDQPVFAYNASIMPSGIPLYVTGFRGQPLPISVDPFIDLQDPCLEYGNQLIFEYVDPEPLLVHIPDICFGDPLQLVVEGSAGPYTVYVDGHAYDFSSSGSVLLVPNLLSEYTLDSYQDGNGCLVEVNMPLEYEVFQPGNIELTSPFTELCNSDWEGASTTVDLNNYLNIDLAGTWADPSASGALVGSVFDADGLLPGTYTVEFTSDPVGSCPSEFLSFDVEVVACVCPELDIQELSVCNSENSIDLSSFIPVGLEGGLWSVENQGGGIAAPIVQFGVLIFDSNVSGPFNIIYDYSQLGFLGCPGTDTIQIQIEAPVLVDLSSDRLDVCMSDLPVDLSSLEPAGIAGDWSYEGLSEVTLLNSVIESVAEGGSYVLYFTGTDIGYCEAEKDSLLVNVFELPERLNIEDKFVEIQCFEPSIHIGNSDLCNLSDYEFLWHTIDGADINDIYACQPLVSGAGTYELIIYDQSTGCEAIDTVFVFEAQDAPDFDVNIDPITCFGDNDGHIELTSVTVVHAPYSVFVNGVYLDEDAFIDSLSPGDYELLLVDSMGCSVSKQLTIYEPAEMVLVLVPFDPVVQVGSQIELEALSNYPDLIYNWNTASGDYSNYGPHLEIPVFFDQTVYLEGINNNGCIRSLEINLEALDKFKVYVPNIFSPNNDGINDLVTVFSGSNISLVHSFKLFSRWGGLMYENYNFLPNDLSIGWDGMVNGRKAAEGDYVWYAEIEVEEGTTRMFKGDVVLIR